MGKKILIVEDNENDSFIIQKYLKGLGLTDITATADAFEGIRLAIEINPDIVVSDTILAGCDGFEVCRQIREKSGNKALKIIIMTGSVDAIDAVKARKSGADDYCAKTSDCQAIVEAVKKLID